MCNLTGLETTTTGKIEIAQDPYRPSSFRARVAYDRYIGWISGESTVRFDVYTTGNVKNTDGVFDCNLRDNYDADDLTALGDIFHPL